MLLLFLLLSSGTAMAQPGKNAATPTGNIVLVIHGGAGTILKANMTPAKEAAYKAGLTDALQKGYDTLAKGGTALDAVETAVRLLEDNPLFNAGKGAVFTNEGRNEMDAAIMNGQTLAAGSVAGVTTIRNPISTARAVMEKSKHVMMMGPGAEKFAASVGQQIVDPSYFYTKERWDGLLKARQEDKTDTSKSPVEKIKEGTAKMKEAAGKNEQQALLKQSENKDYKYGTVGAVALDRYGNLAAATSTGGMTNKKFGRVGDAPIIGAGTYANNATCAVSCTGWGEFFIRLVVAKTISDLVEYKDYSIQKAADEVCMKLVPALGGDGGLIAIDKNGNIAMPFNTAGMYRGYIKDGKTVIKIYNNANEDKLYGGQGKNPNGKGDAGSPNGNPDSFGNSPGGKIGGLRVSKGDRRIINNYIFMEDLPKATINAIIRVSPEGRGTYIGVDKGSTSSDSRYASAIRSYLPNIQFNKSDHESVVTVSFNFRVQ